MARLQPKAFAAAVLGQLQARPLPMKALFGRLQRLHGVDFTAPGEHWNVRILRLARRGLIAVALVRGSNLLIHPDHIKSPLTVNLQDATDRKVLADWLTEHGGNEDVVDALRKGKRFTFGKPQPLEAVSLLQQTIALLKDPNRRN